jgi:cytidine deaminase
MYTTTYPCHECARLIIGAGLRRVVYVDPYPKSQVSKMFAREVADSPQEGKVSFEPYRGIAPRLYRSVFRMTGRRRDPYSGEYEIWDPAKALPRITEDAQLLNNLVAAEDQFYEAAFQLLINTSWSDVLTKIFGLDK